MFNDAQLENLREFRKILTTPQIEFRDLSGRPPRRATLVPKSSQNASQPRPNRKQGYSKSEIRRSGPSTNVTSKTWETAPAKISREDRKRNSKGYYVGCRWSPAPGSRNWQKPQYGNQ